MHISSTIQASGNGYFPSNIDFKPTTIGFALGIILLLGGIFLILASLQILPRSINVVSELGLNGRISSCAVAILGLGITAFSTARLSHLAKEELEERATTNCQLFLAQKKLVLDPTKLDAAVNHYYKAAKYISNAHELATVFSVLTIFETQNPNRSNAQEKILCKTHLILAKRFYIEADYINAFSSFQKAAVKLSLDEESLLYWTLSSIEIKKSNEAESIFKRIENRTIKRFQSEYETIYIHLGNFHFASKKETQALEYYSFLMTFGKSRALSSISSKILSIFQRFNTNEALLNEWVEKFVMIFFDLSQKTPKNQTYFLYALKIALFKKEKCFPNPYSYVASQLSSPKPSSEFIEIVETLGQLEYFLKRYSNAINCFKFLATHRSSAFEKYKIFHSHSLLEENKEHETAIQLLGQIVFESQLNPEEQRSYKLSSFLLGDYFWGLHSNTFSYTANAIQQLSSFSWNFSSNETKAASFYKNALSHIYLLPVEKLSTFISFLQNTKNNELRETSLALARSYLRSNENLSRPTACLYYLLAMYPSKGTKFFHSVDCQKALNGFLITIESLLHHQEHHAYCLKLINLALVARGNVDDHFDIECSTNARYEELQVVVAKASFPSISNQQFEYTVDTGARLHLFKAFLLEAGHFSQEEIWKEYRQACYLAPENPLGATALFLEDDQSAFISDEKLIEIYKRTAIEWNAGRDRKKQQEWKTLFGSQR